MWLHTEPYAPDEPEGAQQRSGLVTKKEFRMMLLGFVGIFIILIPVYLNNRKTAFKETCKQNLRSVAAAIDAYCNDQEGYYPLPYYLDNTGAPQLDNGDVKSWVTTVQPYMNTRKNFVCPEAHESELVRNALGGGKFVLSSYGIVPGAICQITEGGRMITMRKDEIADPNNVLLLTETSNKGARESFDPLPFEDDQAKTQPWDGFIVGFEMDNHVPDVQDGNDVIKSNYVTRLAFPGTDKGSFEKSEGRHEGNFAVSSSGSLSKIKADQAYVRRNRDGQPVAPWWPTNNRSFVRK